MTSVRRRRLAPARRRLVPAAMLVALAIQAAGVAQEPRAMTLVDLAEIPRILDPQLSPDGRAVIYMLNRADWKANRQVGHLWRQDIGGGPPTQLTFGDTGESSGRWSPDGKTILFLRDANIHLLPADGGEPRQLTKHATATGSPAWSPDGSTIYFLATDARTAEERERDRLRDDLTAFESHLKHRHLWKVVVATGAEQRLTDGDSSTISYRVSRDGTRIVLERLPTPLAADSQRGEVWVMDASGERATALTQNGVEESDAELSPDNSQVMFLADAALIDGRLEPLHSGNVFVVPASGGAPRVLLPDFPYEIYRATWAPDGRSIFALVNMGVHSEVFQIDVASGRATALTDGQHYIPPTWSLVASAGQIVVQIDEPTRFGDAWTLPIAGGRLTRVTSIYDALDKTFRLPQQEKVEWKGADGVAVEGVLFYPIDYRAGTRYPLVVQMHGGPRESSSFGAGPGLLLNYFPVLAGKGYAVLRPNYRGSTGYGDAFLRDPIGAYFRNMHLDVIAGVDFLVKQGVADPNRLAVMGWSAGGHLTNKLITFTDRFKAASSGAGAADWTSMYAQTDTRWERTLWFGGTPYQKNAPIDLYWEQSPLKYVANVRTPTLFFVGENDVRVPKEQSIAMYGALQSHGVPTRLYIAPREPHMWGELRHHVSKANAELEWFEKYLMGRPYAPEQAPGDSDRDRPRSSQ